jgi:hypothetical protein
LFQKVKVSIFAVISLAVILLSKELSFIEQLEIKKTDNKIKDISNRKSAIK